MKTRARVNFKGRVQGVFFRANTQKAAHRFNVNGWVRNLRDGSVEAVFEGEKGDVENLIGWCRNEQPHARVVGVKVKWEDHSGEYESFEIRY
jgi:acylphosphatase